ncbi:MAG: hypothetical protein JW749_10900 [Sedimentisphaerales bacterium]|nr:hypothetical protein [Sedimentisphaerales bacterium]
MPLLSNKEVLRLKLESVPADLLKELATIKELPGRKKGEIVKSLAALPFNQDELDKFIRERYAKKVQERQKTIPDDILLNELHKVQSFQWGVVQGQLDNKIQVQYVRKYYKYDILLQRVKDELFDSVRDYVICTWYNHWTTVIIEDLISTHPKVVPTLNNLKGVDIFFDGQPFDLKITYLPSGYDGGCNTSSDLKKLAVWLYENQGDQRFGSDNRMFVVVHDRQNREDSWKIKKDINFIKASIDKFFKEEKVSSDDEVVFTFKKNTYTALSKILFIAK